MRYGWVRTAAVVAMAAALSSCGREAAPGVDADAAANLRAAEFFMESNAKADGVQTLPSGVQYKVLQAGPPGGEPLSYLFKYPGGAGAGPRFLHRLRDR